MERLKELYYEYANNKEYEDLPELKKLRKDLYNRLESDFSREKLLDLDNSISFLEATNEMQGWVYGFKYAMNILTACGLKEPISKC